MRSIWAKLDQAEAEAPLPIFRAPIPPDQVPAGYDAAIAPSTRSSLSDVMDKLDSGAISSVAQFVEEMKRPFLNAIRYWIAKAALDGLIRVTAFQRIAQFDALMSSNELLAASYAAAMGHPYRPWEASFPEAQTAHATLNELLRREEKGFKDTFGKPLQRFNDFLRPVEFYFTPPPAYYERIERPLAIAHVVASLYSGSYATAEAFAGDMGSIFANAQRWYTPDHIVFKSAQRCSTDFVDTWGRHLKKYRAAAAVATGAGAGGIASSSGGAAPRKSLAAGAVIPLPLSELPPGGHPMPPQFVAACDALLKKVERSDWVSRAEQFTGMRVKMGTEFASDITEVVATRPVYRTVAPNPIDLPKIHAKLTAGGYSSPSELAGDVLLMLDNCRRFNPEPRHGYVQLCDGFWAKFSGLYAEQFPGHPLPTAPASYPHAGIVVGPAAPGADAFGLAPLPDLIVLAAPPAPPPPASPAPAPAPVAPASAMTSGDADAPKPKIKLVLKASSSSVVATAGAGTAAGSSAPPAAAPVPEPAPTAAVATAPPPPRKSLTAGIKRQRPGTPDTDATDGGGDVGASTVSVGGAADPVEVHFVEQQSSYSNFAAPSASGAVPALKGKPGRKSNAERAAAAAAASSAQAADVIEVEDEGGELEVEEEEEAVYSSQGLHDVPLATDKQLQKHTVDGMLVRSRLLALRIGCFARILTVRRDRRCYWVFSVTLLFTSILAPACR